jgi:NADPH2:quinone reductase
MVVVYGAASGPAPAIEPELLNKKGCLFLTRPSVFPHNADPERLKANAADLFAAVEAGAVHVEIGLKLPLSEVAQAHAMVEARRTRGAVVFVP